MSAALRFVHLLALAGRVGVPLRLSRFDELSRQTPMIVNVRPSGRHLFEDVQRAGGVPAVPANEPMDRLYSAFGQWYKVGGKTGEITYRTNRGDLEEILRSIRNGKQYSDFMIVTIHCHQNNYAYQQYGFDHEVPDFLVDFAHKAIENGADVFNKFGKAAQDAGLTFGYHCHGYEFVPSPQGTLFDTFAGLADPKLVLFQIDVFHAFNGGADPVPLIEKHKGRVKSLHVKDRKKGVPVKAGSAGAEDPDMDVPVGTGGIDYPAVLRAAKKAGVAYYYIEDESKDPLGHIPQSVAFLSSVKV